MPGSDRHTDIDGLRLLLDPAPAWLTCVYIETRMCALVLPASDSS